MGNIMWFAPLAAFAVTLLIARPLICELRKLKAGQEIRADGPRWHASKAGTPTMGGIMFILGSSIAVFILGWEFMLGGVFTHLYVYLFALIFGVIGFVDDYRKVRQHQNEGLTARQKFVLQLAAAVVFLCLMRYEGLLTNRLYVPFFNVTVTVNWVLYLIFAAFVIVGCVNAVNLTDGVDGLAASVTLVVMVFFAVLGALWSTGGVQYLFPGALAGGLAAFLVYNHHPAKVFMGDTGSLFLGGAVAALLGGWDGALATLLGFMAVDYVTGMLVAGVFHRSGKTSSGALSSNVGFRGLTKKGVMLLMVLVGARLDGFLGLRFIRDGVTIAFMANELLSILENAALMGVPVPQVLRQALDLLRQREDGSEEP